MAHVPSSTLEAFAAAAANLCATLETPCRTSVWLGKVLEELACCYAFAHHFCEHCHGEKYEDLDSFMVSDAAWKAMYDSLFGVLGDASYYWAYFDPTDPRDSTQSLVLGDLADDLADIYRDLKPGVRAWENDRTRFADSIFLQWGEPSFSSHWGVHAVAAMRALHSLVHLRGLLDQNE